MLLNLILVPEFCFSHWNPVPRPFLVLSLPPLCLPPPFTSPFHSLSSFSIPFSYFLPPSFTPQSIHTKLNSTRLPRHEPEFLTQPKEGAGDAWWGGRGERISFNWKSCLIVFLYVLFRVFSPQDKEPQLELILWLKQWRLMVKKSR